MVRPQQPEAFRKDEMRQGSGVLRLFRRRLKGIGNAAQYDRVKRVVGALFDGVIALGIELTIREAMGGDSLGYRAQVGSVVVSA